MKNNKLTKTILTGTLIITGALSLFTTTAKAEESNTIDKKQLTTLTLKVAYNHLSDFTMRKGERNTPIRMMDNKIIGDTMNTLTKTYRVDTDTMLGIILYSQPKSVLSGAKLK